IKITKREYDKLWIKYEEEAWKLGGTRLVSAKRFGSAGFFFGDTFYGFGKNDRGVWENLGRIDHLSPVGCKSPKFKKTMVKCLVKRKSGRGFAYFKDEHLPYKGKCQEVQKEWSN
ncbi:MAG: hypothetical protein ACXABY_36135, partial [Candidatus Thorarchaeota archaeon]